MKKWIIDQIVTRGPESSKRIQYELRGGGKFLGSDERQYPGITDAQYAAHAHIDGFPDVYERAEKIEFLHFD